jgi:hypothetical protein
MFTKKVIGSGDVGREIDDGIGSLVVDYKRYPPMDMFASETPLNKEITRVDLVTGLKFRSIYVTTNPPHKRGRLNILGTACSGVSTKISVAIEADRCEYLLKDSEGYVSRLVPITEPRKWITKKKD